MRVPRILLVLWLALAATATRPIAWAQPTADGWAVPGQLMVRFQPGTTGAVESAAHRSVGGRVIRGFRTLPGLRVVAVGGDPGRAVRAYERSPGVEYAEPNLRWTVGEAPSRIPDDPLFDQQWNLHDSGDADVDGPEAWDTTTGSRSVVVGVIDTGADHTHPDLEQALRANMPECRGSAGVDDDGNGFVDDCHGIDTIDGDSVPEDDFGHGTHVAGIVGARGNNGRGVTGVAWRVRVLACRSHDELGNATTASVIACLDYMALMRDRGTPIVATNNSYAGCPEACGFSQALYDAIAGQLERGILFVAAAGNFAQDADREPAYPAGYFLPNVLSVAATDDGDALSWFSNTGRRTVHLAAPGQLVLSTASGGGHEYMSGTSMAAPHVSGIAALLAAHRPDMGWRAIRNLLLTGGDRVPDLVAATVTGRRASAAGSLGCGDRRTFGVLRPLPEEDGSGPITIAALNVRCARPRGALSVTIRPDRITLDLRDGGRGGDLASRDGIYSARWRPVPCSPGPRTLEFSNGRSVSFEVTCP